MPPQIDLIQLPKELGRRNGEPGLADDDMAVRHRVQILKDLAPSFGQRGTARDAESHIRADFFGKRLQLFPAHVRTEQPIHSAQHRCRVRRTACHPRTDGDFFLHADTDPLILNPLFCAEQLCRPHGKIAPVGRNVPEIAGRADSGLIGSFQLNDIGQRDRLHHHQHLVIPVAAFLCDIQGQIQFCVCRFPDFLFQIPALSFPLSFSGLRSGPSAVPDRKGIPAAHKASP